jgi:hypothetical protein
LGEVFRRLAEQKESRVLDGHLMPDHVHMLLSIPRKYAVSEVVGYIKGKSAIHMARTYGEHKQNFVGQHFWARGYFVSTVGRNETAIRSISAIKKSRISAWTNCGCGNSRRKAVLLIRPQGNATLPPTHSAKSAEWMGHSVSKLLGRINNNVGPR